MNPSLIEYSIYWELIFNSKHDLYFSSDNSFSSQGFTDQIFEGENHYQTHIWVTFMAY